MLAHALSHSRRNHSSSCSPATHRSPVAAIAGLTAYLVLTACSTATIAQAEAPAAATTGAAPGSPPSRKPAPEAAPTPGPAVGVAPATQLAQTPDTAPGTSGTPATPAPGAGPAPGAPPPGARPGMPPGGPPPLPVLLGFADFMLTIDRPYEAEKIYKAILSFVPNNPAAQQGLRDVAFAKRPTFQFLGHYYEDTHDVELSTYGGGPTFRTRFGRITFTTGTGHYRNHNDPTNKQNPLSLTPTIPSAADNVTLQKSTYNLILEPYYKNYEGYFFVSNTTYDKAPDRILYDVHLSYVPDPRERYTITHGRHDSYYQNQAQQFFAPENYFMLVRKILYDDTSINLQHPLTNKIDFNFSYRNFKYTDGNYRNNFRTLIMYRLKGTQRHPLPIFRVGVDTILDNSKFFTLDYSSSFNFNAYSLAADYVWLSRTTKYGFFASTPVGKDHFNPPQAFVGFYNHNITKDYEIFAQVVGFKAPGVSLNFGDYVIGVNRRF
jgi:hypothetical protein